MMKHLWLVMGLLCLFSTGWSQNGSEKDPTPHPSIAIGANFSQQFQNQIDPDAFVRSTKVLFSVPVWNNTSGSVLRVDVAGRFGGRNILDIDSILCSQDPKCPRCITGLSCPTFRVDLESRIINVGLSWESWLVQNRLKGSLYGQIGIAQFTTSPLQSTDSLWVVGNTVYPESLDFEQTFYTPAFAAGLRLNWYLTEAFQLFGELQLDRIQQSSAVLQEELSNGDSFRVPIEQKKYLQFSPAVGIALSLR